MVENKITYSVKEAAAALGISTPTMYTLIKRADFPAFKVGTRTLIPKVKLEEWVEKESKGENKCPH